MPREMILSVTDADGKQIWPITDTPPVGNRVISPQAAYIISDILNGNTKPEVNPYWGEWRIMDGKTRRPAAYKTGTTSDNRDVHAYGYLAPPEDPKAPALAVGVWMGNSNNEPNKGSLSLDSSAPLWSAILNEVSQGLPIADFKQPDGIVTADVDAFSGLLPGPFTNTTFNELFIDGTVPTQRDDLHAPVDIDSATGLLWQDGCAGPKETRGFLDFSKAEPGFPQWQPNTLNWATRAAQGPGTSLTLPDSGTTSSSGAKTPKVVRTSFFYGGKFFPFGYSWGGEFAPGDTCTPIPLGPCPTAAPHKTPGPGGTPPSPTPVPQPTPSCIPPTPGPSPSPTPAPTQRVFPTPRFTPSPRPSPTQGPPSPTP
jgi:membrane peptidoglycan carboxypeptidase